jgi:5-oxoprolinase (ATP-hydrolysing)
MRYHVGLDIGGTFTDYILFDGAGGRLQLHKRLTTPHDPAEGALAGLHELLASSGVDLTEVGSLLHGTTLVTNAIIERRGRPTGLLTTKGFRDVLEMGHEQRYDIYDLFLQYPEPIVPRRWRLEVDERLDRDGRVLRPLNPSSIDPLIDVLVGDGVESIAVCFLHAYRNADHERVVGERIAARHPNLYVSLSSDVVPEIREYARTNTTACNAYVQPVMDRYLRRIDDDLRAKGFVGRFSMMLSSGGAASPETARRFPVRLLESGPAGGALATAYLGSRAGLSDLLAFDMGGTTAKACLIRDGRPDIAAEMEAGRVHRFKRGSGLPIRAPVVDMIEIGAGGGSIARKDALGLLKVGPDSASADPGPACYGLGGTDATVTDACLVLGYYDAGYFLGGAMKLDKAASTLACGALGSRLGLSALEVAWGIHEVVCENMAGAARVHIIEKGHDPRDFPVLAFGGAGPAHAARVARILGAREMLVPPVSGVASALGFLVAPVSHEVVRSFPVAFDQIDPTAIARVLSDMEADARAVLASAGVPPDLVTIERSVEARLIGQFHEIEVPVPQGDIDATTGAVLSDAFERAYAATYHTVLEGYRPMAMSWRLRAMAPAPEVRLAEAPSGGVAAPKGARRAYFPEAGGFVETPVYDRGTLAVGVRIVGPAILEERESTTVVAPGDVVRVDEVGNLRVAIAQRSAANPAGQEVRT